MILQLSTLDKYYACGRFEAGTINTYGTSSFAIQLDSMGLVEHLKFLTTNSNTPGGDGLICHLDYSQKMHAVMTSGSTHLYLFKFTMPDFASPLVYYSALPLSGLTLHSLRVNINYFDAMIVAFEYSHSSYVDMVFTCQASISSPFNVYTTN